MMNRCLFGTYVNKNNKELVRLFKKACQEAGISAASKAVFESNCRYLEVYSCDMGKTDPYEIVATDKPDPGHVELEIDDVNAILAFESKQEDWSGEGLPPVGAECEICNCGSNWQSAKVLFMGTGLCVVDHGYGDQHYHLNSVKFRKPETPQQREERERDEYMQELSSELKAKVNFNNSLLPLTIARIMHDAGYRKAK